MRIQVYSLFLDLLVEDFLGWVCQGDVHIVVSSCHNLHTRDSGKIQLYNLVLLKTNPVVFETNPVMAGNEDIELV